MKKGLGIGRSDFKKIIEDNCYYFDKTKFIEDIIKDKAEVKLFTRPRRFGKTLNLSMLKYFFDIEKKEENREIFKNLYIEKSEYFKYQGANPVIFISLKDLGARIWEEQLEWIEILISKLYNDYKYLQDELKEPDLTKFKKYSRRENLRVSDLKESLYFLTKLLYQKYNKKVILLIDEYDKGLTESYMNNYYKEAQNFFTVFFGAVLKDNVYLEFAVMTGIIRVIRAGIFSELNNVTTYTILDECYETSFGLTEDEVMEAVKYYGLEYETAEVKRWYDGYRFGNSDVYNPWSIIKFLSTRKLEAHWVGTSSNDLIKSALRVADSKTMETLEKLFQGKKIEQVVTGTADLTGMLGFKEIWELMLFSGYLTVDEKIERNLYSIRIPNYEVLEFFKDSFIDINFGERGLFVMMMWNLMRNELEEFEEKFQRILLQSTSYHDTKSEDFYHGLFLGMSLYLDEKYIVRSNIESGLGRFDCSLEPKDKKKPGFIIEFKATDDESKLEKVAEEAMQQMIDKKYDTALEMTDTKEIIHIGVAFCGKQVKLKYKK